MFKRSISLLAGISGLLAGPALAADLNYDYGYGNTPTAGYETPSSGYNWDGAYAGIAAGYSFGELDTDANGVRGSTDTSGISGAIYGGYNKTLSKDVVAGVEAEVGLTPESDFNVNGVSGKIDSEIDANVRGRVGVTFDNVMVYGTAGVSVAQGDAHFNGGSDSNTHFGYVVGAGVEAGLTDHITARAEYLYNDTKKEAYGVGGDRVRTDLDSHKIRLGAGYKF